MKRRGSDSQDRSRTEGPDGAGAAEPTLERALQRLEEIAARLETGTLDLEGSLTLYREARDLHSYCVARLAAAERDLQILMSDGTLQVETPGEGDAEAEGA